MAKASGRTGVPIVVDTRQLSSLTRALRVAGPESGAAARGAMRDAGKLVKADAQERASYSKRIPGSIKSRATAGNFKVIAGGAAAPNAAPIENKGLGFVRHPVFVPAAKLPGPPGSWTEKNSHPAFLAPALADNADAIAELVADRLTRAVARALGG